MSANARGMRGFMVLFGAIVSSVAAAVFVGDPAAAQTRADGRAVAPYGPVAISKCSGGIASVELVEIAAYDVVFRNNGTVPADEVRLSARYGRHQKRASFDVKGAFAPGADVSRHLRRAVSGGLYTYESDQNDCDVEYVHFTDGTNWSRPPQR